VISVRSLQRSEGDVFPNGMLYKLSAMERQTFYRDSIARLTRLLMLINNMYTVCAF